MKSSPTCCLNRIQHRSTIHNRDRELLKVLSTLYYLYSINVAIPIDSNIQVKPSYLLSCNQDYHLIKSLHLPMTTNHEYFYLLMY